MIDILSESEYKIVGTYSEWELNNLILSTGFAGLEVKGYTIYYLWNFIITDKFELEKDNFCNGTTMEAINNENIRKINILIPVKEILELFSNSIKSIYGKIHLNQISIQTLSTLSDTLLPKLISGKIRISTTPSAYFSVKKRCFLKHRKIYGCPLLSRRGV
ncbi:MAG: restriction endonuclease subunit S domain-containing protein [bacterium]